MTPTQLEAAMRRAGVGQYENMTGKPYPYKSRLEEAEAIVVELGTDWRDVALLHIAMRRHEHSDGCDGCLNVQRQIQLALAAAEPAKEGAEG